MNEIYLPVNDDMPIPAGFIRLDLFNVITKKHEYSLIKNLWMDAGSHSVADRLRGATDKGIITYCAVGTGTTAANRGQTKLVTELYRKLISVRSVVNNIATFQTYFTTAEAIGTLKEFGLFGDAATSAADSGTMFARTTGTRVKTSNDTLTLSWSVVIGA